MLSGSRYNIELAFKHVLNASSTSNTQLSLYTISANEGPYLQTKSSLLSGNLSCNSVMKSVLSSNAM